jgi:hypothetical protein
LGHGQRPQHTGGPSGAAADSRHNHAGSRGSSPVPHPSAARGPLPVGKRGRPLPGRTSPGPQGDGATFQDPALAAASLVRPKALFPPITRPSNPEDLPAASPQRPPHFVPSAWGGPGQLRAPSPATASSLPRSPQPGARGLREGVVHSKSARSATTSLQAGPGSPIAPPDNREQFLIWLDSTFGGDGVAAGGAGTLLDGGDCGGGFRDEAQRRRQQRRAFEEQWGLVCSGGRGGKEAGGTDGKGLQRLLCRPLHHLWQGSPDAYTRQGSWGL